MLVQQIPKEKVRGAEILIAVIDVSKSMENYFQHLATSWNETTKNNESFLIMFDRKATQLEESVLEGDLYKYGGGGTNITCGFELLDKKLKKTDPSISITLIFVSDGDDNNQATLANRINNLLGHRNKFNISFLCLGVGKEFPTRVALRLRQKYHNGDPSVPAIFLIEYPSKAAFDNKFSQLKEFFSPNKKRTVSQKVHAVPWNFTSEIFEEGYFVSNTKEIKVDGKIDLLCTPIVNNPDAVSDLFRTWSQTLNCDLLNRESKVLENAKVTFQMMEKVISMFKEQRSFDLITGKPVEKDFDEQELLMVNSLKEKLHKVSWYIKDIREILYGEKSSTTDDFEAAKRIGLGTILTGAQKRSNLISEVSHRNYFHAFLKNLKGMTNIDPKSPKLELDDSEGQSEYFFNYLAYDLNSQSKLLSSCMNSTFHDFIRIRGWGINLKKIPKKEATDPQAIFAIEVAFGDTKNYSFLEKTPLPKIEIDKNRSISLNAVLPVLKDIGDVAEPLIMDPFFLSKIKSMIVKSNVFDPKDAYLALLSSSFFYFFEAQSEKLMLISNQISSTEYMLTQHVPVFSEFKSKIFDDPISLLDSNLKLFDEKMFARISLMVFTAKKFDEHSIDKMKLVIQVLFVACLNINKSNDCKSGFPYEYIKGKVIISKEQEESLLKQMESDFNRFFTIRNFTTHFDEQLPRLITSCPKEIFFKVTNPPLKDTQKDIFEKLQTLFDYVIGSRFTEKDLIDISYAMMLTDKRSELEAALKVDKKNLEIQKKVKNQMEVFFNQKLLNSEMINHNEIGIRMRDELEIRFEQNFRKLHKMVLPLSLDAILQYRKERSLQTTFPSAYDPKTGFDTKSCMSPDCPFFLVQSHYFSSHLRGWGSKLPKTFHSTVRNNLKKTPIEIFDLFDKSFELKEQFDRYQPDRYELSKEEVIDYISKVQEAYRKLND